MRKFRTRVKFNRYLFHIKTALSALPERVFDVSWQEPPEVNMLPKCVTLFSISYSKPLYVGQAIGNRPPF